jgi:hypothetical protein
MNRTLLLILCDFLLLTLLALTRWETAEPERPATPPPAQTEAQDGAATGAQDIVELMKLSFEDQRAEQDALAAQLASTSSELAARESTVEQLQAERSQLATSLDQTQQTAAQLRDQVASSAEAAAASRARVDQLQRDLEIREAEAAKQTAEVARLAQEQAVAQEKIQNLNVAVRVAEQEKVMLRETADTFRQQAEVERQERIKVQETTVQLAEGVGQLAEKSAAMSQEMRDNRPINANTLFSEFLINRVPTTFVGVRPGILGDITRNSDARTILVSDGTNTFAIVHLEDTPLSFFEPTLRWSSMAVTLAKGGAKVNAPELRFLQRDPRVVVIPVSAAEAESLGVKIYRVATDPFRFPDAVLISNGGNGYGEVPFKLDASLPGYVRMDNRLVRRLFGDFSPTRGDLVLSKTGDLLGVMVSSDLCVMVDSFAPAATLKTGNLDPQAVATLLEGLATRVERRTPSGRGR